MYYADYDYTSVFKVAYFKKYTKVIIVGLSWFTIKF